MNARMSEEMVNWRKNVVCVSPAMASDWIRRHANDRNRKINRPRVKAYVREMLRGRWIVSPLSALGFATDGMLLNGHHRLTALVESNVTCEFVVFRDVPFDALRVCDTELPRTAAQIGQMFGDPTTFDQPLKGIHSLRRNGSSDWVSPSDVDELRTEFASIISEYGSHILAIRVAGRKLRAGAISGLLLGLARPESKGPPTADVARFISELAAVSDRTALGSSSVRNLVKWLEERSGAHSRFLDESAQAVAQAIRLFSSGADRAFLKPSSEALADYLPRPR